MEELKTLNCCRISVLEDGDNCQVWVDTELLMANIVPLYLYVSISLCLLISMSLYLYVSMSLYLYVSIMGLQL